jgi:hypothetical protein
MLKKARIVPGMQVRVKKELALDSPWICFGKEFAVPAGTALTLVLGPHRLKEPNCPANVVTVEHLGKTHDVFYCDFVRSCEEV